MHTIYEMYNLYCPLLHITLLNIHRIMILLFLINLLGTFLELKDPFNTYVLIQELRELAPGLKVHSR